MPKSPKANKQKSWGPPPAQCSSLTNSSFSRGTKAALKTHSSWNENNLFGAMRKDVQNILFNEKGTEWQIESILAFG